MGDEGGGAAGFKWWWDGVGSERVRAGGASVSGCRCRVIRVHAEVQVSEAGAGRQDWHAALQNWWGLWQHWE